MLQLYEGSESEYACSRIFGAISIIISSFFHNTAFRRGPDEENPPEQDEDEEVSTCKIEEKPPEEPDDVEWEREDGDEEVGLEDVPNLTFLTQCAKQCLDVCLSERA